MVDINADIALAHRKLDVLIAAVSFLLKETRTMSKAHDDLLAEIKAIDASADAVIAELKAGEGTLADIATAAQGVKAKLDAAITPVAAAPVV